MIMLTSTAILTATHALPLAISGDMRSRLLLIGALIAVTGGIMLALWLISGRRHARRHKHQLHRWQLPADPKRSGEPMPKHRHRKERPMNPTLADTGGLPARRPDNPDGGPDHPTVPN